jgi:hypothetical protein
MASTRRGAQHHMSAADKHDEASKHHRQAASTWKAATTTRAEITVMRLAAMPRRRMQHGDEAAMEHAASHGGQK